jgi:hypothetical protein
MKLVIKMREGQERVRKHVLQQSLDWTMTDGPFLKSETHDPL